MTLHVQFDGDCFTADEFFRSSVVQVCARRSLEKRALNDRAVHLPLKAGLRVGCRAGTKSAQVEELSEFPSCRGSSAG